MIISSWLGSGETFFGKIMSEVILYPTLYVYYVKKYMMSVCLTIGNVKYGSDG